MRYALAIVSAAALICFAGRGSADDMKNADKVRVYCVKTGKIETVDVVRKSDAEWMKVLTPEQYAVTRRSFTEQPDTNACGLPGREGIYRCVCCGLDLFYYKHKFESGTGWPSFVEPVSDLNVRTAPDASHGMTRTEVLCARCGAHLGHVFEDGPPPTHKRYCINSIALTVRER